MTLKKIKVLHLPIYNIGGVNSYVLNSWKFIDKSRFQFDFATLNKTPLTFEAELREQGCKIHYISCYAEESKQKFTDELNAVFDENYDVVHIHTSLWRGFLINQIAMERNIPTVIIHAHSTGIHVNDKTEREKLALIHNKNKSSISEKLGTHFCACSEAAADWIFGNQVPMDKICILNNAINIEEFSYKPTVRDEYRKKLSLEDSFVIGWVGMMRYPKNPEMVIEVFNGACKAVSNAKLLLIGDGELREDVEKRVNDLGLSDKVLFLGNRNDVSALMQAMDVFILPSRFEGLPISLIEAQTAGLKCLTSEFVTKEAKITSNLKFMPYDNEVWVSKITDIYYSDYIRVDMSEEVAKSGYSVKEQIKILEGIYNNA